MKGRGITFLFTEEDIKDDSFLEYMNNLMSVGEV
jgi:dynein heavy chain